MKLSFKFKNKLNEKQLAIIEELSYHTTKLYNIVNYDLRETEFKYYKDTNELYNSNWHKDFLHSHNYQHCLKVLEKNWKSYFTSIKDYKKNPNKYKGEPKPPKFKNNNNKKNEIIFTNLAIRFRNNTLMLSLSKTMQHQFEVNSLNFEVSEKLQNLINWNSIQQVKIKWDNSSREWYLIIIYIANEKEKTSNTNIMSIDLGLSNLATITFKDNEETYIINGKTLKTVNSYANSKIAYLESIEMKKVGNKKFKETKAIKKLRNYRHNYILNYMHKSSKKIIDLSLKHNVGTIVIGDIKDIKQRNTIKSFVQIPIQKLVQLITYKTELEGIQIERINESYTSGVSALDLEPINKEYYNKNRRIFRGMFKSNLGICVNSDINGSLNILRKYIECTPRTIEIVRDNGFVNNPIRISVA